MKPILSVAALAIALSATSLLADAKTPTPKAHPTVVKAKVSTTTVTPAATTPCAAPQSNWPAGNASARQIQANPANPQFSCNGLRTATGQYAATEADMRPPMSAKAAAAADIDDYIGMGNTIPPERK